MSDTGTVVRGRLPQTICFLPEDVLLLAEHSMAVKHRKALHWFSSFSKVLIWSILDCFLDYYTQKLLQQDYKNNGRTSNGSVHLGLTLVGFSVIKHQIYQACNYIFAFIFSILRALHGTKQYWKNILCSHTASETKVAKFCTIQME